MIGRLTRLLLWRFARRTGPIGLLTILGGPFPRPVLVFVALAGRSARAAKCFHAVRVAPGRRCCVPSPSGRG